jgi:hypothetical protein
MTQRDEWGGDRRARKKVRKQLNQKLPMLKLTKKTSLFSTKHQDIRSKNSILRQVQQPKRNKLKMMQKEYIFSHVLKEYY